MNEQASRNFLVRVWLGFWRLIDGLRRAIFNIIFLLLLVFIIALWLKSEEIKPLQPKTTLDLRPQGQVVEQYTLSPFERTINRLSGSEQDETRLRDLIDAVNFAADDRNISQMLVDVRQLTGIGLASAGELRDAIRAFRNRGKQVIAIGAIMDQQQYLLASSADEVWLEQGGLVWLDGFASYRNYFKEGLDRLKVEINLFRVGDFKSASEPLVRNDMSEADRAARMFLLNDLWQQYLDAVGRQRGLPVAMLDSTVDRYSNRVVDAGGDMATLALDLGLVDRLVTRPQARAELARMGSSDKQGGYRSINFLDYLQRVDSEAASGDGVGIVVVQGAIVSGEAPPAQAGSATIAKRLRRALEDDRIKAVVLRIDSPGGDAYAAEVIRREVENVVSGGKPVVVSMSNVAASGGYWIAMGADEVISNSNTITGSIGIFGVFPTFQDTLADLGIHTDGVGTVPQAGAMRLDRALPEAVKAQLQAMIEDGYRDFLGIVSEHRQMSREEVDAVAQGRVWTGRQALERNLVDVEGGLRTAVEAAARRAGLERYDLHWIEDRAGPWQQFLLNMGAKLFTLAGLDAGVFQGWRGDWMPAMIEQRFRQQLVPFLQDAERPRKLAHCLCAMP